MRSGFRYDRYAYLVFETVLRASEIDLNLGVTHSCFELVHRQFGYEHFFATFSGLFTAR